MAHKQKKVCVCGHFAFGKDLLNGQTVKTKIVSTELCRVYGEDEVIKIDTHGGPFALFAVLLRLFAVMFRTKNVVILPAHNGVRVIAPYLAILNLFFRRKLHYAVIGGWLPGFLSGRRVLTACLKRFSGIYVETQTLKRELEKAGFENVYVMTNCKELPVLKKEELDKSPCEPYRLCTFSRVMEQKGIEDAVNAVRAVNEKLCRDVFTLDIYGPVDTRQIEWFEKLRVSFPDSVKYKGTVDFDKSVETVSAYFALVFPTRFYTEGIPGTIIDAYASGVPVISSMWESFGDMVDNGVTGIGYDFGNYDKLTELLLTVAENPSLINSKREACLEKAKEFSPEKAVSVLTQGLA